jgi:hypothetical protein
MVGVVEVLEFFIILSAAIAATVAISASFSLANNLPGLGGPAEFCRYCLL